MSDPLESLIIAIALIIVASVVFFPGKGLLARRKKHKRNSDRVLLEDALKHLYDCEYKKTSCSIQSIAGSLSITADRSARLLEKLESMGLLLSDEKGLHLTKAGRSYALRVIRIHRLLEKYLADETGIEETSWHAEAEEKEHSYTFAQANALAARMGNPLFDPHGDPIPTAEGKLPERMEKSLSAVNPGETVQIVHIEDEPYAVYAQLAAEGLYPGMYIRMTESTKERIVFEANGEEVVLAPLFAANISVAPIPEEAPVINKYKNLASLKAGESAAVIGISQACRGVQRRRLMDLGVVPGSNITAELVSTGGDPVAYRIRDALIALRRQHAELIFVRDLDLAGKK